MKLKSFSTDRSAPRETAGATAQLRCPGARQRRRWLWRFMLPRARFARCEIPSGSRRTRKPPGRRSSPAEKPWARPVAYQPQQRARVAGNPQNHRRGVEGLASHDVEDVVQWGETAHHRHQQRPPHGRHGVNIGRQEDAHERLHHEPRHHNDGNHPQRVSAIGFLAIRTRSR